MKVKKQHYVPRFYLKSFSIDEKKLFVYDKRLNKSFCSVINDLATQNYFYDHKGLDEISQYQTIESYLSMLESDHAIIFKRFLFNLVKGFSGLDQIDVRALMSEFIALQLLRTPTGFKLISRLNEQLGDELKKNGWQIDSWEEFQKSFNPKDQFNYGLIEMEKKGLILFNKLWIIWKVETERKFITSDSPIVTWFEPVENGYEIFFPLSPNFALSLYDREKYSKYIQLEGEIVPISDEYIKSYNSLVYNTAERQCYSIDGNFDLPF